MATARQRSTTVAQSPAAATSAEWTKPPPVCLTLPLHPPLLINPSTLWASQSHRRGPRWASLSATERWCGATGPHQPPAALHHQPAILTHSPHPLPQNSSAPSRSMAHPLIAVLVSWFPMTRNHLMSLTRRAECWTMVLLSLMASSRQPVGTVECTAPSLIVQAHSHPRQMDLTAYQSLTQVQMARDMAPWMAITESMASNILTRFETFSLPPAISDILLF